MYKEILWSLLANREIEEEEKEYKENIMRSINVRKASKLGRDKTRKGIPRRCQ